MKKPVVTKEVLSEKEREYYKQMSEERLLRAATDMAVAFIRMNGGISLGQGKHFACVAKAMLGEIRSNE